MASWVLVSVGWTLMVGSTVTGYFRSFAASHAGSAVTVRIVRPPSTESRWVTALLQVLPFGEEGASALSYMNGLGR
jgi:hypothetical protein